MRPTTARYALLTLGAALVIGTGCATLLGIEPVPAAPDGGGGPPPEEAATTDAPSSLDDDAGEEIDGGCIDFRGPELDAGVLCAAGPNGRCGRGETCCSQEDRMAISCTATEDACPVGADRTEAWSCETSSSCALGLRCCAALSLLDAGCHIQVDLTDKFWSSCQPPVDGGCGSYDVQLCRAGDPVGCPAGTVCRVVALDMAAGTGTFGACLPPP